MTTSAPSIPLACFSNKSQILFRKGETASRFIFFTETFPCCGRQLTEARKVQSNLSQRPAFNPYESYCGQLRPHSPVQQAQPAQHSAYRGTRCRGRRALGTFHQASLSRQANGKN